MIKNIWNDIFNPIEYDLKPPIDERLRQTGRTSKTILKAVTTMLEGKNVIIVYANWIQVRSCKLIVNNILHSLGINFKTVESRHKICIEFRNSRQTIEFKINPPSVDSLRGIRNPPEVFFDHYYLEVR